MGTAVVGEGGGGEGSKEQGGWGETNPMVILAYMPQGVGFGTLRAIVCVGGVRERGGDG